MTATRARRGRKDAPRQASGGGSPADTLISDIQPPGLGDKAPLGLKPPGLWRFVTAPRSPRGAVCPSRHLPAHVSGRPGGCSAGGPSADLPLRLPPSIQEGVPWGFVPIEDFTLLSSRNPGSHHPRATFCVNFLTWGQVAAHPGPAAEGKGQRAEGGRGVSSHSPAPAGPVCTQTSSASSKPSGHTQTKLPGVL